MQTENLYRRSDIVRLLSAVLLTSTDLDHFLCVYFPGIWEDCSAQMERGQKEILLISKHSPEIIYQQLFAYYPERVRTNSEILLGPINTRSAMLREQLSTLYNRRAAIDIEIHGINLQLRAGNQIKPDEYLGPRRYLLKNIIGIGPVATVWYARDQYSGKDIVARLLKPEHALEPARVKQFRESAWKMAELRHDGIVRLIQEPTEENGIHYWIEEWMNGGNLERIITTASLTRQQWVASLVGVAKAVSYAHKKGAEFAHTDIKPSNILFNVSGVGRLNNFDIRPTKTPNAYGYIHENQAIFLAPEVMKGKSQIAIPADIYSFSMTLIYAFVGLEKIQELDICDCIDNIPISRSAKKYLESATRDRVQERPVSLDDLISELDSYHEPIALNPSSLLSVDVSRE